MQVLQPTLWDNVDLETGYRYLAGLDLEEASRHFNLALRGAGHELSTIQTALDACQYWQPRINQYSKTSTDSRNEPRTPPVRKIMEEYLEYSFSPKLAGFQKRLLIHLTDRLLKEREMDSDNLETVFDLLLQLGETQKAEDLIMQFIDQQSDQMTFLYFLAQGQWQNGNKTEAIRNYALALIHFPDKAFNGRIESGALIDLIEEKGPEKAPAYGWLQGILPLIHIPDDVKALNQEHKNALTAYRLMREAHLSGNNKDLQASVRYRKQFKAYAPVLYQEYFNRIGRLT